MLDVPLPLLSVPLASAGRNYLDGGSPAGPLPLRVALPHAQLQGDDAWEGQPRDASSQLWLVADDKATPIGDPTPPVAALNDTVMAVAVPGETKDADETVRVSPMLIAKGARAHAEAQRKAMAIAPAVGPLKHLEWSRPGEERHTRSLLAVGRRQWAVTELRVDGSVPTAEVGRGQCNAVVTCCATMTSGFVLVCRAGHVHLGTGTMLGSLSRGVRALRVIDESGDVTYLVGTREREVRTMDVDHAPALLTPAAPLLMPV